MKLFLGIVGILAFWGIIATLDNGGFGYLLGGAIVVCLIAGWPEAAIGVAVIAAIAGVRAAWDMAK